MERYKEIFQTKLIFQDSFFLYLPSRTQVPSVVFLLEETTTSQTCREEITSWLSDKIEV